MADTTSIVVDKVAVDSNTGYVSITVHSVTTNGTSTWNGPSQSYGLDTNQYANQFSSEISQVTAWIVNQHTAFNGANTTLTAALGTLVGQTISGTPVNTTGTPVFSPPSGTYGSVVAEIVCATPGAAIYYTTDGTTPTTGSTLYSAAITVSVTTTIKAIAVATNYANSAVATVVYTIGEL
jgi:hypothetical protein